MLFCIWFTVFLTQCSIDVLDIFPFATAQTTSVGSTSPAMETQKTVIEKLPFWDGEVFKTCKKHKACRKNGKNIHVNKRLKKKYGKHRRYLLGYASLSDEEHKMSTRFAWEDLDHTGHLSDLESSLEKTIRNTEINGYTLLGDMTSLMKRLKDQNASVSVIGKTVERHDIVVCKISQPSIRHTQLQLRTHDKYVEDEVHEKKIILIVHGLSSMGFKEVPCLHKKRSFMKLLHMYMKHLHQFDLLVVPMGNPDGISDKTLKLWNKNKRPQEECLGVAVDRNFDVAWNKSHRLHYCSQQYHGPSPLSEPESRAIADLIHMHNQKIIAYIHVHAGTYDQRTYKGDAVLHPKGYTDENADEKYTDLAAAIQEDIRNAGFKKYDVHVTSLYKWYGQISGSSVDYATTVYGIPYGLEFVMQSYYDDHETRTTAEETQDNVLTEVWSRVIQVVFDGIYKTTESDSD